MSEESKSELEKIFDIAKKDDNLITIGTTVDTGFEWQAIDECREKISQNLRVFKDRGKIYFNIPIDDFYKVEQLKSIDNIYILADVKYYSYNKDDKEYNFKLLKDSLLTNKSQLDKSINAWKKFTKFPGKIFPSIEEYEKVVDTHKAAKEEQKKNSADEKSVPGKKKRGKDPASANENDILSYRVSCERSGIHAFESQEVAVNLGGEFNDLYNWIVDLTDYQLEILYKITHGETILHLRVTTESMHRRNIAFFGPTTLRATICYNLLRLAKPKPGEIIIDPMCGGGSIPIEAAKEFPLSFIIGGDNHEKAMERSRLNISMLPKAYKTDLIKWNLEKLPFKDSYVDAFVTDMPFGKRMGSMSDNRVQYKKYLLELGRVVKMKYGRLVLLTYDRRSITVALKSASDLFRVKKTLSISMGGLNAAAYVLKRTNLTYESFISRVTTLVKPRKSSSSSDKSE
ncbi:tRNA (guanine(6)-N2)-methyltransferase THUMP3 [Microplitis demolitor]|uniref:tRNA (guanine(6)-N2)-methyltransferase THUMP3 n=1 Tax=Microplitis demolitor TaxID=69319 RepID=UPI0004CD95DC|nr:tRNA (guanine(6)-N2)-methyltransferase THUMP3 [Microplitis demolitor]